MGQYFRHGDSLVGSRFLHTWRDHEGNVFVLVVGDDPRAIRIGKARSPVRKLGRHQGDVLRVGIEQLLHDGLRTSRHLELLLVAIQVLVEKMLESNVLLIDRW